MIALKRGNDLSFGKDWPLLATGLGGIIVLSFDYTLAYEDALRASIVFNEGEENKFDSRHPEAP